MLQDRVFSDSEGDRWFARNRRALNAFDASADSARLLELYSLWSYSVLEIGAANGFRLAAIHQSPAPKRGG